MRHTSSAVIFTYTIHDHVNFGSRSGQIDISAYVGKLLCRIHILRVHLVAGHTYKWGVGYLRRTCTHLPTFQGVCWARSARTVPRRGRVCLRARSARCPRWGGMPGAKRPNVPEGGRVGRARSAQGNYGVVKWARRQFGAFYGLCEGV